MNRYGSDRQTSIVRTFERFLECFVGSSRWLITCEQSDGRGRHTLCERCSDGLLLAQSQFSEASLARGWTDKTLTKSQRLDGVSPKALILHIAIPLESHSRCVATLAWDAPEPGRQVDIAEPHLVEMVEDFAKIAFEKVRDDALFGMFKSSIDRLGLGCVIFDHKGQIAFANDAARMLLSRSGTRRSVSVPKGTATALPKLLANLATDERIRLNNDSKSGAYVVRPFALPDGTIRPAYICSFASKGEGAAVGDARRCYTVFIPTHKGVSDVRALKIAFQLTRKEARLAHLIASGRTVQESAVDMDWKVNSARTYLKRVFAKVGVASQAQLTATAARLYVPETNDSSWDDTLESMDED